MTEPSREQMAERIAAIQARAEAATQGPWWFEENELTWCLHGVHAVVPADEFIPEQVINHQILKAPKKNTTYAEYWPSKADADFITESRTDVPWLLEQVQVLQERIAHLERVVDDQLSSSARGALRIVELERRIAKVREMAGEIECGQGCCDHPVKLHDGGRCTATVFPDQMCRCTRRNKVADQILAVLDGEGEHSVEPALATLSKADIESMYAVVDAPYQEGVHVPLADDDEEKPPRASGGILKPGTLYNIGESGCVLMPPTSDEEKR